MKLPRFFLERGGKLIFKLMLFLAVCHSLMAPLAVVRWVMLFRRKMRGVHIFFHCVCWCTLCFMFVMRCSRLEMSIKVSFVKHDFSHAGESSAKMGSSFFRAF